MVLGNNEVPTFVLGSQLDTLAEKIVHLLAAVLNSPVFDDDAVAAVHQPACELLSCLLARLQPDEARSLRRAFGVAISDTVEVAGRENGSAMADSLTMCVQSAIPALEIAACQLIDLLLTDAADLHTLHMSNIQV